MNLCSERHYEVCYEGSDCPACAVYSEMNDRIDELKRDLASVTDERDSLLLAEP